MLKRVKYTCNCCCSMCRGQNVLFLVLNGQFTCKNGQNHSENTHFTSILRIYCIQTSKTLLQAQIRRKLAPCNAVGLCKHNDI